MAPLVHKTGGLTLLEVEELRGDDNRQPQEDHKPKQDRYGRPLHVLCIVELILDVLLNCPFHATGAVEVTLDDIILQHHPTDDPTPDETTHRVLMPCNPLHVSGLVLAEPELLAIQNTSARLIMNTTCQ